MKTIHIRRLRKLATFLRKLPRKRFNFAIIRNEPPKCGAVGCAIGYTPNVFPSVFRSFVIPPSWTCEWTHGVGFRGELNPDFIKVAEWVSGLEGFTASALFEPGNQGLVDRRLPFLRKSATPKQVAAMLEKFIKLQTEKTK
jgi:hypothetical protein